MSQDTSTIIAAIGGGVQAIAAIINLIIIICFYCNDKNEREITRNEQELVSKEKKIIEKKEGWYKEIVINRAVGIIEDFFCKNNHLIVSMNLKIRDSSELKNYIDSYNNDYYDMKHIVLPSIKIFDNGLYQSLLNVFTNYSDNFTQKIEKSFKNKYLEYTIKQEPDKCKGEVLQLLYSYDITSLL